jgi:hypothetical protein
VLDGVHRHLAPGRGSVMLGREGER